MNTKYWTYALGGDEPIDAEFDTKHEAIKYAEETYEESCANGDESTEDQEIDIKYIEFSYDESGVTITHDTIEDTLYYEYYHGDDEEHNVRWNQ